MPIALLARQVDQHREPGGALDEGADRRALQPDDEIAFPVPGHGTVLGFGRAFADHHLGRDVAPRPSAGSGSWHPQCPPGAQAGHELALERSAALDVERLVDRLVADAHGLIIGEIDLQPLGDLLGTPPLSPSDDPHDAACSSLPLRTGWADDSPSGVRTAPDSRSWT